ncbi:MAG: phosphatidylserine/phosphatidylglycerophosphate/cardiolipin synthase family protein [Verrucomicrobiia bacterium]
MDINIIYLQEKNQKPDQGVKVANALASFMMAAKRSVHIMAYHFALKDPKLVEPVVDALKDRAAAGVEVQIGYYYEHKFDPRAFGGVTKPTGTEEFLGTLTEGTDIELRPIRGLSLMHNKYVVRDGQTSNAAVWTGSTNFTDGAWKLMENNIVQVSSPELCSYYENDFSELWKNEDIKGSGSGAMDSGTVEVDNIPITVEFSPGKGKQIDQIITQEISAAKNRIKIASMVLSSATILGALADAVENKQVTSFGGIYDGPETSQALSQATGGTPELFDEIKSYLVGKASRKFNPEKPDADYNYMHNKIAVCDDTVVTGSFNFSRKATQNAENVLVIRNKTLADSFTIYIDQLVKIYKKR